MTPQHDNDRLTGKLPAFLLAVLASALRQSWAALLKTKVISCLRNDRPLAWAFALLSLTAIAPIFAAPLLPLTDVGFNGQAGLLSELVLGDGFLNHYFGVNWRPLPYWSAYAVQGGLTLLFGPLTAIKLLLGLLAVALPLSYLRLALAIDRDPRICLFAFIFVWDKNVYWGWLSFQLGMILLLWVIALVVETRSIKDALWVLPWTALVGISHPHAILLLAVAGSLVAISQRPLLPGVLRCGVALSGTLMTVVPWLAFKAIEAPSSSLGGGSYTVNNPTIASKLEGLYGYTLGNYVVPDVQAWASVVFTVVLFAPAVLGGLQQRRSTSSLLTSGALFFGALLLYLALPFEFWGATSHWWTFPRYGTFVLLGALLLPAADLRLLRIWGLLPCAVIAIGLHAVTFRQFRDFGKRTAAFLEIIDALPMHQRLYPVSYQWRDPAVSGHALLSLHGYAAMAKRAYDPHLFRAKDIPVFYRRDLPQHNWMDASSFRFEQHGKYYDYILLYPNSSKPLTRALQEGKVKLAHQAGPWRLYQVIEPSPYVKPSVKND